MNNQPNPFDENENEWHDHSYQVGYREGFEAGAKKERDGFVNKKLEQKKKLNQVIISAEVIENE